MIKLSLLALVLAPLAAASPVQPKMGEGACFQRVYSREHLRNNPRQILDGLTVWVNSERPTPEVDFNFKSARVVGTKAGGLWGNQAACQYRADGSIHCSIDCDGGSFGMRPASDGVLFTVTKDYYFPLFRKGADPEAADDKDILRFDGNDRDNAIYKLQPVDEGVCRRVWQQYQEVPAIGC